MENGVSGVVQFKRPLVKINRLLAPSDATYKSAFYLKQWDEWKTLRSLSHKGIYCQFLLGIPLHASEWRFEQDEILQSLFCRKGPCLGSKKATKGTVMLFLFNFGPIIVLKFLERAMQWNTICVNQLVWNCLRKGDWSPTIDFHIQKIWMKSVSRPKRQATTFSHNLLKDGLRKLKQPRLDSCGPSNPERCTNREVQKTADLLQDPQSEWCNRILHLESRNWLWKWWATIFE